MKTKHILTVIAIFFTFIAVGQQSILKKSRRVYTGPVRPHFELSVSLGTSYYSGEVANASTPYSLAREVRPQLGIRIAHTGSRYTTLGLEVVFGSWYATDAHHQNLYNRNWYAESNYIFPSINIKQLIPIKIKHKLIRWNPYIESGLGVQIHNTKAYEIGSNKVMVDPGVKYSFGISGGLGINYQLNRDLDLFLGGLLSFHPSDDVDNLIYAVKEPDKIGIFRFGFTYKLPSKKR